MESLKHFADWGFCLVSVYKTPNAIKKRREIFNAMKEKRAVSATRQRGAGERSRK